jgi:hypothetical protein
LLEAASWWRLIIWDQFTYTRYHLPALIVHGDMIILQCNIDRFDFLIKVPLSRVGATIADIVAFWVFSAVIASEAKQSRGPQT